MSCFLLQLCRLSPSLSNPQKHQLIWETLLFVNFRFCMARAIRYFFSPENIYSFRCCSFDVSIFFQIMLLRPHFKTIRTESASVEFLLPLQCQILNSLWELTSLLISYSIDFNISKHSARIGKCEKPVLNKVSHYLMLEYITLLLVMQWYKRYTSVHICINVNVWEVLHWS